uniref:Copper transport protein n=1 Tax=Strigops habroptila TaxID=2489341 RepID=A0A672UVT5_STRHB
MQMSFYFSDTAVLLFDFWSVHTPTGMVLSVLVILLLSMLYEAVKMGKAVLLRRALRALPPSLSQDPLLEPEEGAPSPTQGGAGLHGDAGSDVLQRLDLPWGHRGLHSGLFRGVPPARSGLVTSHGMLHAFCCLSGIAAVTLLGLSSCAVQDAAPRDLLWGLAQLRVGIAGEGEPHGQPCATVLWWLSPGLRELWLGDDGGGVLSVSSPHHRKVHAGWNGNGAVMGMGTHRTGTPVPSCPALPCTKPLFTQCLLGRTGVLMGPPPAQCFRDGVGAAP